MLFAPTALPMPKARITNASQPQKAAFRCLLLQRAIRAARLGADGCESIRFPSRNQGGRATRPVADTGTGRKRPYYAPHGLYSTPEIIPTPSFGTARQGGRRTARRWGQCRLPRRALRGRHIIAAWGLAAELRQVPLLDDALCACSASTSTAR